MIDRFRFDHAGSRYGVARGVGRQTILVDANGLEALGIGRIGKNIVGNFIIEVYVIAEVPVGDRWRADLW